MALVGGRANTAARWWDRLGNTDRRQYAGLAGVSVTVVGARWDQLSEAERSAIGGVHDRAKRQYLRLRAQFEVIGAAGAAA